MNIGLVPTLNPFSGGAHQYALAMIEAISRLAKNNHDASTYSLFVRPEERESLQGLNDVGWNRVVVYASLSDRIGARIKSWIGHGAFREALGRVRRQITSRRFQILDQVRHGSELGKRLRQHGIDWALYTGLDSNSLESGVPYVMPVFDLQHRLQPDFPEVSCEWDEREYIFRNVAREATLILADSEIGKEDILECYGAYGVTPDRVKVLPYPPAPYLATDVRPHERARVRAAYRLPARYLFYPAQLWPHKNHVRIIQALGLLKETNGIDVHVVFCGTHGGAIRTRVFKEMMREAQRLRVVEQLHYLGYVPNDAMSALYAEAAGLVMPTFFGPTNIPIVEAWQFRCPAITSDIRGIREQVGDAGLLVDPRSVEAIAEGMRRLWEDEALRGDLAQRGARRLARYSREDFCVQLAGIIVEANLRVAECRPAVSHRMFSDHIIRKSA